MGPADARAVADGPAAADGTGAAAWPADYAALATVLGVALRDAGIPAGPDRCERLGRALTVVRAVTLAEVHTCALATMVADPSQIEAFERVFAELFYPAATPRQPTVMAPRPGMEIDPDSAAPADASPAASRDGEGSVPSLPSAAAVPAGSPGQDDDEEADDDRSAAVRRVASATERLRRRDFNSLSADELRAVAVLMRELVIAVPPRQTRRYRPRKDGARLDMRRTLRLARRTGGEPVQIARRAVRSRPRRLVVLCDISGSMEPYARALLQFMYASSRAAVGAPGGVRGASRPRTEVFTFATRLTRLTPALAAATPEIMLAKASEAAVDWAGGTRIGAALHDFMERYGVRGMARGSVILIISDGWETGDPALLGAQMARLHRLAHKVVWANPRTQSERYRPEVGGMAAAWPYCDAVVSAHNFDALDDLLAALRAPSSRGRPVPPLPSAPAPAKPPGPAPAKPAPSVPERWSPWRS
ncbi:MAG TPA: VWA domain-containing protein [Trebonia sp.]|jgi:hypothetical protein|nr:VWA domain-containing protein [Trebonia sp.]